MTRMKMITSDEAVHAKGQHKKPCGDCPWRRGAIRGWLGPLTGTEWTEAAHGEGRIDCHTLTGAQCAGAAIFRGNICKSPRDPETLVLPSDRTKVFAWDNEFLDHHSYGLRKRG